MQATIAIGAGASANPSPITSPAGLPPGNLIPLGPRNRETDTQPCSLWLALHGTATETVTVSIWACWDDVQTVADADRKWALVQSGVVVTVGAVTRAQATPGLIYVQVTTASTHASTLAVLPSDHRYEPPAAA